MTMNKIMAKLRKNSKGQYTLLGVCIFLSVLMVSAFAFFILFSHGTGTPANRRRYKKTVMAALFCNSGRLYHLHYIRRGSVF